MSKKLPSKVLPLSPCINPYMHEIFLVILLHDLGPLGKWKRKKGMAQLTKQTYFSFT